MLFADQSHSGASNRYAPRVWSVTSSFWLNQCSICNGSAAYLAGHMARCLAQLLHTNATDVTAAALLIFITGLPNVLIHASHSLL